MKSLFITICISAMILHCMVVLAQETSSPVDVNNSSNNTKSGNKVGSPNIDGSTNNNTDGGKTAESANSVDSTKANEKILKERLRALRNEIPELSKTCKKFAKSLRPREMGSIEIVCDFLVSNKDKKEDVGCSESDFNKVYNVLCNLDNGDNNNDNGGNNNNNGGNNNNNGGDFNAK